MTGRDFESVDPTLHEKPNPYRSPEATEDLAPKCLARADALFRFRVAVALLVIAAIANAFFLPRYTYILNRPMGSPTKYQIGAPDLMFIGAIGLFALMFTFKILEGSAKFLRREFAPNSDTAAWNNAIYNAFRPAIPLGLLGALLWIIWVVAFFELRINFYVISYAVGIPAHLLAAGIYLPLLYGWFKAARTTSVTP